MMFVLSSPSGAGKTTLTKKLAANNTNFRISISHTTRKARSNEINGKDYYFVNVVLPVPEGEDNTNIIPRLFTTILKTDRLDAFLNF